MFGTGDFSEDWSGCTSDGGLTLLGFSTARRLLTRGTEPGSPLLTALIKPQLGSNSFKVHASAHEVYLQKTSALCISELLLAHDNEFNTLFIAASVHVKEVGLTFREAECELLLAL